MEIKYKVEKFGIGGKKQLTNATVEEDTIIIDDDSRDKFISLVNNLAAKVDIVGSLNKLIDKIDLLQKLDILKTAKIIKKVMEDKKNVK